MLEHVSGSPPAEKELDSRISLQKLEILRMVVEVGTVTGTAERMYVAQPVITAHLQSLEGRLGVELFVRKGRRLELTDEGERVYSWACGVLDRGRDMMVELDALNRGARGAARLGASMSIGSYRLPAVLSEFRLARPQAQIALTIGNPETVLVGVEQGDFDFAVLILDRPPEDLPLAAELLGSEEIVLVTAPDGLPDSEAVPLNHLCKLPIVGSPRGSIRRRLIDQTLARFGVHEYETVLELGHAEAIKRAVDQGLGAALLFRSAVEVELARDALREVHFTGATLAVPIYAVKREDKVFSELQTHLLDAIRERIASVSPKREG